MKKKNRGKDLDELLVETLKEMLENGHKISPITRSSVQERLGLKSRSTLLIKRRANLIDQARIQQLHDAGLDADKKKRRSTQEELIGSLKNRIAELEQERNILMEKLAQIANGLQAKGFDVEKLMLPLRPNYKPKNHNK